jgi:hypothetical protein
MHVRMERVGTQLTQPRKCLLQSQSRLWLDNEPPRMQAETAQRLRLHPKCRVLAIYLESVSHQISMQGDDTGSGSYYAFSCASARRQDSADSWPRPYVPVLGIRNYMFSRCCLGDSR